MRVLKLDRDRDRISSFPSLAVLLLDCTAFSSSNVGLSRADKNAKSFHETFLVFPGKNSRSSPSDGNVGDVGDASPWPHPVSGSKDHVASPPLDKYSP